MQRGLDSLSLSLLLFSNSSDVTYVLVAGKRQDGKMSSSAYESTDSGRETGKREREREREREKEKLCLLAG